MNKRLLDRLGKLEQRRNVEHQDVRNMSREDLMAVVAESLGHMPTRADLERIAAGGEGWDAEKAQKTRLQEFTDE